MSVLFLVPGFLGFTQLGRARYFSDAFRQHLRDALADHNRASVPVVALGTVPAGSLAERQAELLRQVAAQGLKPGTPLHFIGHSTGALDVELLLRSRFLVGQGQQQQASDLRANTRTLVALAAAASGSGIAASAVGRAVAGASPLAGRKLAHALGVDVLAGALQLASGIALSPWALVTALSAVPLLWSDPMARQLVVQLFGAPKPVLAYLGQLALNRALLFDLQPAHARTTLLAAGPLQSGAVIRRFVTVAPAPPAFAPSAAGWLFKAMYEACASGAPEADPLHQQAVAALRARWATLPITNQQVPRPPFERASSDGIVNTALQLPQSSHAELATGLTQIARLVVADHLDVVGAIPQGSSHSAEGLLNSGARFGDAELRTLCQQMVHEIAPQL